MELYYVNYYNDFRCIGADCEDTCCAMWDIEIDNKTYEKYKACPGEWGRRFAASIDDRERCFLKKGKDCVFLNDKHLCDIQSAFGEDMLCRTCKMFPRHMEDYGERREFMISLACPEAARMILFKTEPVTFHRRVKERSIPEEDRVDEALLFALLELREAISQILHKRDMDFAVRSAMVLGLGHDAHRYIKQQDWTGLNRVLKRYTQAGAAAGFNKRLEKWAAEASKQQSLQQQMKNYLHMLEGLEILDERWSAILKETQTLLYEEETEESYELLLKEFLRAENANELIYENLTEYFIISYLVGAVFDREAYTKVKFALYSVLAIRELYLARYKKNRAAGEAALKDSDRVELAYWYSREIENSQNNLDALDIVLGAHPEFTLERMLVPFIRSRRQEEI
ncbi:MAG: flagellin lysine-N-methylase [Lachnospiraceae bacterium]|nr:flagellin lysine-N-methylase [Lachnospiraceae bacterium]